MLRIKYELRSEKVRNIIGGVPPRLVRAGTVVIITICVALALAAWLKKIILKEIKEVGTYTAVIKLHREVKVDVQFEVVSEATRFLK